MAALKGEYSKQALLKIVTEGSAGYNTMRTPRLSSKVKRVSLTSSQEEEKVRSMLTTGSRYQKKRQTFAKEPGTTSLDAQIRIIKGDFKNAIRHLSFSKTQCDTNDDLLDFAILIALYCQELNVLKRILCEPSERGDFPLSPEDEDEMGSKRYYDWKHIEGDPDIVKILGRIQELKRFQDKHATIHSKGFA